MISTINRIEWVDSLNLNIKEIDLQHQKLVSIINKLYEILAKDDPSVNYKLEMSKIVKSLFDYTLYHFESEEKFMAVHRYPEIANHKQIHAAFVGKIQSEILKLSNANKSFAEDFYHFLSDWLVVHIAQTDSNWAKFVHNKEK